jgi:uncharacterized repeat protein (TIGR01451 family)
MKLRRLALLTSLTAIAALGLIGVAPAAASPLFSLDMHHNQTNFPPGGTAEYSFDVENIGDADNTGPVTVTLQLPPGLTRHSVRSEFYTLEGQNIAWKCPGAPGDTTVTCTTTNEVVATAQAFVIEPNSNVRTLVVTVDVAPDAAPDLTATATLSGGGAPEARPGANCPPGVAACTSEPTHVGSEVPPFGVVPGSWIADFYEDDAATPVRQAGAHPDRAVFSFDFNSAPAGRNDDYGDTVYGAVGNIRHVTVELPPGFVGNPTAVGECTPVQLTGGECPPSSVVGAAHATVFPGLYSVTRFTVSSRVYNMAHPLGVITDLAFLLHGIPVHVRASLDPANHYAIRTTTSDINETLQPFNTRVTIWGVPGAANHNSARCPSGPCSVGGNIRPFLTVPAQCDTTNRMIFSHYDTWQNSGVFGPDVFYDMPGKQTGCDKPRFEPDVEIVPTGKQANTPTGLDVHVKVAQNENPNGLGTPPVKTFTVTLPKGMSFSPSFADGLQGCSLAQMGLGTNDPVTCPDAARIGEVELHTPLLPKPAVGSMYLASQGDNPFGSLLALYLVIHDTEQRGALIKIPGKIEVDQTTGQITTVFDDNPQFPFDDLTLKFRSGPRAPLVNPPSCGTQTIGVHVASYAQPDAPVDVSNTYQVTEGPNGTPCPPDSAHRPFHPRVEGGTLNPSAGTYSPFVFRLAREDQEQELSQVTTILPPGLVAKIAGIPPCSDAAIASISTAEGTGVTERDHPACPVASQIGTISAGLGAGPGPNYFPGKVYLAGPYKGAPLSLAVVAPGLAGPLDLGNVVVRAALRIDPTTAQVTAVSDPFPTILHGVLLRVRDIRLRVDRPDTTINPTSCAQMAVGAKVTGVGGDLLSTADDSLFSTSNPFQVGDCASLGFKPSLALKLIGGTHRGSHPKLHATLTYPKAGAYANIASASVALPHSEFLDQAHIGTVCTRVQFAADQCPAASVYGSAKAVTPLFGSPLEGPVYLRSSDNELPDLVIVLKGPASQPIEVDLAGRVDSVNGGIRNSFEVVPDAPVTSFTLDLLGGKKGLLVNSTNLCARVHRATAKFKAQNGKALTTRPALQTSCKKSAKQHTKHKPRPKQRADRPVSALSSAMGWLAAIL